MLFCARASGVLALLIGILFPSIATAACSLPNNLLNGQIADAGQVMGNFNALNSCLDNTGSVTTGTAGQLGHYSSSGNQISGESLSDILDADIGTAQGSIVFRGATGWQAIAPGAPGYVLSTNGAGADPSWIIQGSGGKFSAFPGNVASFSEARSAHLNVVKIAGNINVTDLACVITTVSGGNYKMGLASWDPVNLKITSSPIYTASQTIVAGAAGTPLYFTFNSAVPLSAGNYAVILIRTDGSTSTNMTLNYGSGFFWAPRLYMTGSGSVYGLASQSPTTSDVWTSEGSGYWTLGLMYAF